MTTSPALAMVIIARQCPVLITSMPHHFVRPPFDQFDHVWVADERTVAHTPPVLSRIQGYNPPSPRYKFKPGRTTSRGGASRTPRTRLARHAGHRRTTRAGNGRAGSQPRSGLREKVTTIVNGYRAEAGNAVAAPDEMTLSRAEATVEAFEDSNC